jgi:hypothetical protein
VIEKSNNLLPGCAILIGFAVSCCSYAPAAPDLDWAIVKERARTWQPVLVRPKNRLRSRSSSESRVPVGPGQPYARPNEARRLGSHSTQELFMEKLTDPGSTFTTDPKYERELINGKPRLSTPDRDSPEALEQEARNQAREREIDRMIRFGICRGC